MGCGVGRRGGKQVWSNMIASPNRRVTISASFLLGYLDPAVFFGSFSQGLPTGPSFLSR